MGPLLERKLIVVTGKGGVGKSTVASALGLAAAGRGLRTIVVELGAQRHLLDLFAADQSSPDDPEHAGHAGRSEPQDPRGEHGHHAAHHDGQAHHNGQTHPDGQTRHDGQEIELQENLWSTTIDPERALGEWLQRLTGRISARLLASSSSFQYFAAAAPGAKELVTMVKLRELCEGSGADAARSSDSARDKRDRACYDLVVLDAPASGHALALLRSPQTFSTIARVGPLAEQAQRVRELLEDPGRSAYVAVTHASEMAVTETLELEEGLRRELDRDLDTVIVNGTMPRRFSLQDLERIALATREGGNGEGADAKVAENAARMARTVNDRARVQLAQIARLRRQRFAEGEPPVVLSVPLAFVPIFDLDAVRRVSARLASKLQDLPPNVTS